MFSTDFIFRQQEMSGWIQAAMQQNTIVGSLSWLTVGRGLGLPIWPTTQKSLNLPEQSTISKLVNLITELAPLDPPSSLISSRESSGIANSIIWLGVLGPASPINSPAKYVLTVPLFQQLPKSSFPHLELL
jgi:hypothetical protein